MSLSKLFNRIFWHNNTTPAINEDNLNAMSKAIDDIDDRVITLGNQILETVPQIVTYLEQAEDLVEAMENLSKHPPYIGQNGDWYVWDVPTATFVDSGIDASITMQIADVTMINYGQTPYITNTGTNTDPVFHLFIPRAAQNVSITKTGTSGLVDTYTITSEDGATQTFTVTNGKGIASLTPMTITPTSTVYELIYTDGTSSFITVYNGRGITSITKTGTSGLVDTYTITYTDNTTSTFTVTNGQDGSGAGDMEKADYDSDSTVKNAGGIKAFIQSLGYITGLAWSALTNKPFSAIGDGLTVNYTGNPDGTLKADVQSVEVNSYGTASSTVIHGTYLEINGLGGVSVPLEEYMEQTIVTSTSQDVTATFTNSAITTDSVIKVRANKWGIVPSNVVTTSGQCVVTIPKQDTAYSLGIRIYIM